MAGLLLALSVVSCGSDTADGDVEKMDRDTYGRIDGTEGGEIRHPVVELWEMSDCSGTGLVASVQHDTMVRVLARKPDCQPVYVEVEVVEGDSEGVRGWISEEFVRSED